MVTAMFMKSEKICSILKQAFMSGTIFLFSSCGEKDHSYKQVDSKCGTISYDGDIFLTQLINKRCLTSYECQMSDCQVRIFPVFPHINETANSAEVLPKSNHFWFLCPWFCTHQCEQCNLHIENVKLVLAPDEWKLHSRQVETVITNHRFKNKTVATFHANYVDLY